MANTSMMRKRSRENDGDISEDFFPLSKRINNLQISGEFVFLPNTSINHLPLQSQCHQQQSSSSSSTSVQSHPPYNPELNLEQNPHYYSTNKDLYELFLLRQLRQQEVSSGNIR